MTRPGAGWRAVRCVAAAAPRGRFRASPSPPPPPATRGHTTFLAGQHGSLAAGSTGVSLPFFGPLALVFFLMLPILNLFHKFLPIYIYWAQSWVWTGFKFIGQEIKLIFNNGIGLQEFHVNYVRISEEFHLRPETNFSPPCFNKNKVRKGLPHKQPAWKAWGCESCLTSLL